MSNDWRDDSLCSQTGPEPFFLTTYKPNNPHVTTAKALCHACPVRTQCLTQTLHDERNLGRSAREGIAGGHTPAERYDMRVGRTVSDLLTTHGTYKGWLLGCRCPRCEAAHQLQLQHEASLKRVPPGVQHGKPRAYQRYGCQCAICLAEKKRIREKELARTRAVREATRTGQLTSAAA